MNKRHSKKCRRCSKSIMLIRLQEIKSKDKSVKGKLRRKRSPMLLSFTKRRKQNKLNLSDNKTNNAITNIYRKWPKKTR